MDSLKEYRENYRQKNKEKLAEYQKRFYQKRGTTNYEPHKKNL